MSKAVWWIMVSCLLAGACGSDATTAPSGRGTAGPRARRTASLPTTATPVGKQDQATFLGTLRDRLIAVGAKLDGAPVTGLDAAGACAATMATAQGRTTFRWADIGDLAASETGSTMTLPLMAKGQPHALTMPAGNGADGINGAIGMLAMDCQSV